MPEARLFLERRSYRRRRMMDAVRILPLLCTLLWLVVPLMWPNGSEGSAQTALSTVIWYLFVVWMLAIMASFALWRRIRRSDTAGDEPAETSGI
ncbi:hypothetical protein [uncultured Sulfitobacter sp.]|uniref:hypothetical protein n=1 Tax=uncultured Sulfitobacter sp. TaxID=191468 RepID=UPI00261CE418|nr:hypothetical protein [uncultured Sulfitobacter sp.]